MAARVKLPEISVHEHSEIVAALSDRMAMKWDQAEATDRNTLEGRREAAGLKADARFIKDLIERIS
jgi:hypothetical protein